MKIYEILEELEIKYEKINHKAVYTIEEANSLKEKIDGIGVKNLLLKDKNEKYFLLLLQNHKKANLKQLSTLLNAKHLTFASEFELETILKLQKGSVTPLGIINDTQNKVLIIIDKDLVGKKLLVHPNVNTSTLSIEYKDLIKFIKHFSHKYKIFNEKLQK